MTPKGYLESDGLPEVGGIALVVACIAFVLFFILLSLAAMSDSMLFDAPWPESGHRRWAHIHAGLGPVEHPSRPGQERATLGHDNGHTRTNNDSRQDRGTSGQLYASTYLYRNEWTDSDSEDSPSLSSVPSLISSDSEETSSESSEDSTLLGL
ncbi:hypothetical protein SUNI508_09910 [Seiridium unicorne]|uniref:Uncharacterized protein n=1 Tax=Seiridium unicorne TaxID=138068 RepID=A0ABR2UNF4_9PEZI